MQTTLSSYLRVFETPSDKLNAKCLIYGCGMLMMSISRRHRDNTVADVRKIFEPALEHKMIKFYFNEDGNAVGYVVWALLAEDVEQRVMETGTFSLHESEWNEGNNLWIIDFLVPFGNLKYVLRDLEDNVFKGRSTARYFREKNNRIILKQMRILQAGSAS